MKKLEEIEWSLKEIWREYRKSVDEDEQKKAEKLLKKYKRLHTIYRRQKEYQREL